MQPLNADFYVPIFNNPFNNCLLYTSSVKTSVIRFTQDFFYILPGHSLLNLHHLLVGYVISRTATEYYPQREKQDYMYIFHNRIVFSELMYDQRPSYSLMKSFILVLLLENVRVPDVYKRQEVIVLCFQLCIGDTGNYHCH